MAFLVGGANSAAVTAYDIDNSVRFDDGAANGLARFGNNSRDNKTFTISFWIKRTELGLQQLVNCKAEDSGSSAFITTINSSDQLVLGGQFTSAGYETLLVTNNLLRDPSAWYHIVFRSDTTQSGATDRFKIYINGTEASYATDDRANVSQDDTWQYFYNASSFPYAISNDERDNVYGDFYMAEHHYCDGVSNAASAFGETDEDSGIWKPKKYEGSHGTYGHYLEFKNSGAGSGTSTVGDHSYTTGSASTIGADTSGNDHHFHVQGYAVTDQTTDTPTNNFATANPLGSNSSAFAEGNLLTTGDTGVNLSLGACSTIGFKKGKWYAEFKPTDAGDNTYVGIQKDGNQLAEDADYQYPDGNLSYNTYAGKKIEGNGTSSADETSYGDTYTDDDIVSVAIDMDNRNLYFYKNGTIQNSGTAAFTSSNIAADTFYFFFTAGYNDSIVHHNYGSPAFAISSGNADANGYGNFEYAVPSGYFALCTKNLAEFG